MGMFSEIATEGTIKQMVIGIQHTIKKSDNKDEIRGLKKAGRISLTLFEWTAPNWAKKYEKLFKE